MFYSSKSALGHLVTLNKAHTGHMSSRIKEETPDAEPVKAFGDVLLNAFNQVNDLQTKSRNLSEQMLLSPDSVNVHDVTTAMAEANMALSMTKSVVDGAIKAYKEIINIR